MLAFLLASTVLALGFPAIPVPDMPMQSAAPLSPPVDPADLQDWSVQWVLGDMAEPFTAEGSITDMAREGAPNTTFLYSVSFDTVSFTDPHTAGQTPACGDIETFGLDWYFGLSGSHDLLVLLMIETAENGAFVPVEPWVLLTFNSSLTTLGAQYADDELIHFEARCDGPDHLWVSFALDGVVTDGDRSIPVRIDTHGSVPIISVEQQD